MYSVYMVLRNFAIWII